MEIYDLAPGGGAAVLNLSTRGRVGAPTEEALIGGIILGNGGHGHSRILWRGRGPSMPTTVPGRLADPTVTLHDGGGTQVLGVDDWGAGAYAQLLNGPYSTYRPSNGFESAFLRDVGAGATTAILRGVGGASGVGIVELFFVE